MIKYAIVIIIAGTWGRALLIPNYAKSILDQVSQVTSSHSDLITYVCIVLPLLLVFIGGILADKYGRRLLWAVFLLLYGGCMLWLTVFAPSGLLATFGPALMVAVLISLSFAFVCSPLAWLFDHEGKYGLKNAYGLIYVLVGLIVLVIIGIRFTGHEGFLQNVSRSIVFAAVSSLLVVVVGLWVITFPENYGNRSSSLPEIARSGINQFIFGKILPLVVLQSIFVEFFRLGRGYSLIRFVLAFNVLPDQMNIFLPIESLAAFLCAGVFLLVMKEIDYKKLIIYPLICAGVLSFVMYFTSTPLMFFILRGGVTALLTLEGAGILILINDSISENRAAALSLLVLCMTVVTLVVTRLAASFSRLEWETLSLISGVCIFVSCGILFMAVRIHLRDTQESLSSPG